MTQVTAVDPYWLGKQLTMLNPGIFTSSFTQLSLALYSTPYGKRTSMNEGIGVRLIASFQSVQSLKPRWRDNARRKPNHLCGIKLTNDDMLNRVAKKAADEANATKVASGSSKIAMPGTPRNTGFNSTNRMTQTPRRRPGI
jgi:hypothetical protein